MKRYILILLIIFCCTNCVKMDDILNPVPQGALNGYSGTWILYGDSLNTDGGIRLYDAWDNQEFNDVYEAPYKGNRCFKYYWNGEEVDGKEWCGMGFLVGKDFNNNYSKDVSAGKYTKIEFYARGHLSKGIEVSFSGPNGESTEDISSLPEEWTKYTIDLNISKLTNVESYFWINFWGSGSGATVYIDDLKYTR